MKGPVALRALAVHVVESSKFMICKGLRVSHRAKLYRRIVIRTVAALAPLAVTAAPASAQLVAPRERAPIEIGAVSLYPRVRIIDSGKDSNVFREATQPKEDYTATVNSRLLGVAKIGANELLFSTGSDYVWFQKYRIRALQQRRIRRAFQRQRQPVPAVHRGKLRRLEFASQP